MASVSEAQGDALRRVPGIDKARRARYLAVVDDNLRLRKGHVDPYGLFSGADLDEEHGP